MLDMPPEKSSSTTSPNHALPLNGLRYIKYLFVVAALPVVLPVVLIAAVLLRTGDLLTPEEIAQRQRADSTLVWNGPLRLYAAIKFAHLNLERPEVVILGASRSGQIRCAIFKPYHCYNASMIGWTFTRLASVIREIGGDMPPKVIFINLDFFMFSSAYESHWIQTEDKMPLNYPLRQIIEDARKDLVTGALASPKSTAQSLWRRSIDPEYEKLDGLRVFGPTFRPGSLSVFRADGSMAYISSFRDQAAQTQQNLTPALSQIAPGRGAQMDIAQMARLQEITAIARQRGIMLVGVQLPFIPSALAVFDAQKDYADRNTSIAAGDLAIWREFESPETVARFVRMGIHFFNFSRLANEWRPYCFFDAVHPGEYLVLESVLQILKEPHIHAALPEIDISPLDALKRQAESKHNCFSVFDS